LTPSRLGSLIPHDVRQTLKITFRHNWVIISFVVGTLIGPGFLWQWKASGLADKKQQLDFDVETTDLRSKEIDLYGQIVVLANEYLKDSATYAKSPSVQLSTEMNQQEIRLDMLKDNFSALEGKLAGLEDRKPRNISLVFYPPHPPTGLTATAH
jgi:hypothetical protein